MSKEHTILVVEDNDFVRMQICSFLTAEEYQIVEARDGDEALQQMGDHIDLAVVDVRMEPMDGFDFMNAMRNEDYKTPVVLVTGDQNHDLLERAGQYQVSSVLMKPVQKERLLKMVERLIARG